jgi:hypothetical protein
LVLRPKQVLVARAHDLLQANRPRTVGDAENAHAHRFQRWVEVRRARAVGKGKGNEIGGELRTHPRNQCVHRAARAALCSRCHAHGRRGQAFQPISKRKRGRKRKKTKTQTQTKRECSPPQVWARVGMPAWAGLWDLCPQERLPFSPCTPAPVPR